MPPLLKKYPKPQKNIKVLDSDKRMIEKMLEDRLYGESKNTGSKTDGFARVVSVHRSEEGLIMRLMASHFYDRGGYLVSPKAKRDLKAVADVLEEIGKPIVVEGHTDSVPAQGKLTNWDISSLRASHVVRAFIVTHGFPKSMIAAAGYADTRPISSNTTKAGRSLNRRIEIRIKYDNL
jgi:chemotaxis protein MotB